MTNKLTRDEKDILDSYDNNEWKSVLTKDTSEKYKLAAKAIFKKDERVNIRISSKDLELLLDRA